MTSKPLGHARRLNALLLPLLVLLSACGPAPATDSQDTTGAMPPTVATATSDRAAVADSTMVASAHILASRAGDEILRKGGNAVDAAVATGFALAVLVPRAGNIGGGGFMVIRFPDGDATAIDFREKAPLAAHPEMWLDENGEYDRDRHHESYWAVGVPGTVAGFAYAHAKYGSLPWAELVEPAVRLAEEGFEVTPALASSWAYLRRRGSRYPATMAKFFKDGEPYEVGERFRQPDLAATLARIRDGGADEFYAGETARLIVAQMERGDGPITMEDLARYEPVEREPVFGTFHEYGVIGMPPPSSGGTAVVEMLNILEGYDLAAMGHNSADYLHYLVEAMRRAYRDRARFLADADFIDVPLDRLTSKAYAAALRNTIRGDTVTPSSVQDTALTTLDMESSETTHFSVVDGNGMAVSNTYTLEHSYGSAITVAGAGFLLNNEMGDFNPGPGLTTESGRIGTAPNLAEPEKRMLSSMTPIILTTPDDQLFAVVGSPGGRTIINTVLQVALNLMVFDMGIFDAVHAPRIHHQWLPDEIEMEGAGWDQDTLDRLRAMGYTLDIGGEQGRANSIRIGPDGRRYGAPDPRYGDAGAAGH
jgi:gamma-glutamyltranspeptidase/glutathione hydrolase